MLEKINSPKDLKKLDLNELPALASEIRDFIVEKVSKTGGHLASNLGVVELTIALHYVFSSPIDKIVWDVGHQSYPHKILTGRKDKFDTLRKHGGISGFPKISESAHDAFGVGHASTSISSALGIAKARDLKNEKFDVIALLGDGALTGGLAFEGLNQLGYLKTKMIVILNDNKMSISMNVGALSGYTRRIQKTERYMQIKKEIDELFENANGLKKNVSKLKEHLEDIINPGLVFEKLGINYIGPIDGHNVFDLIKAFEKAKTINGPILIHALTTKGKGYSHAENNQSKFHGISCFDIESGEKIGCDNGTSFTEGFSNALVRLAEKNDKIIAVTAAMPEGTGLCAFAEKYPSRFFDVGIAEQHAVTFSAGLATQGLIPVVAIYSTFLQRSYDQIIHDVCLQNLHVIFALDRSGIVGDDGPTHHGAFDFSYLRHIPNMTVMAPKDIVELERMLEFSISHQGPIAIRYPRGCSPSAQELNQEKIIIGKSEVIKEGKDALIISTGPILFEAIRAAEELEKENISCSIINARFIKPIDYKIIEKIKEIGKVVILEENSIKGGFGSAVLEEMNKENITAKVKLIGLPDCFVEHGSQSVLKAKIGLTKENIIQEIKNLQQNM